MADRSSAELAGLFFSELADKVSRRPNTICSIAESVWKELRNYDFANYQMECDVALIKLGLARRTDDGIEYRTSDLKEWI